MTISRSVRLRIRNVSDKIEDKIKTHILCSVTLPENRPVCEIMWKNTVEPGRPQMTSQQDEWELHTGWVWLDTHSKCILLIAFPRQELFLERATVLPWQVRRLLSVGIDFFINLHPPWQSCHVFSLPVTLRTTMFKIKNFCMLITLHLCVLYESQNIQQLLPYTALTDWFL